MSYISKFARVLSVALLGFGLSTQAAHANYPERAVNIVVNFAAGGPLDVLVRLIAENASKQLGQPVVVENRTGAAGTVGAQYVSRQKPDGYTLLASIDTLLTVNPFVYTSSNFDARQDMTPATMLGSFSQVLLVRPDLNIKTLDDFIKEAAKGEMLYASAGIAAPGHLAMELFATAQSLKMTHVPYKGNAPATHAFLAGDVDAGFLVVSGVLPHIKSGALQPLAVSGTHRDRLLPDVPTIAESGHDALKDYDVSFGFVLMAPKDVPTEVLDTWSKVIKNAMNDEAVQERMQVLNINPFPTSPQEAQDYLKKESLKWEKLVETAKISVD